MKQKGFTLIEMLVVITIIAILSAVLIVGFSGFITHAKDTKAEQTIREIRLDLFLLTSETPYDALVGTEHYYVSYDFDNDTFVVQADGGAPEHEEIADALEVLFKDVLDSDVFDVNLGETSLKERLDVYGDNTAQTVTIEYNSMRGGRFDWIPTIVPRAMTT